VTFLVTVGRVLFVAAVAASGAMQVVNGEFVRLVRASPDGWLRPGFWPTAAGLLLLALAAGMILRGWSRPAAAALGFLLLLSFVFLRVPEIAADPWTGFRWTNPLKVLALVGGAIVLAVVVPQEDEPRAWAEKGPIVAALLFGVFLAVCGIQHFRYADFVDTLVPTWVPPGPRPWTLFTGLALLAGGIGVLVPRVARLAAICSGLMIFLWVLLLHIPRAWTMRSAFELAGVFEALAMSGIAFMLAGGKRREPHG
jgi:uncharacterized membrane protein YphA (DoxX/SURF4 family)